MYCGECGAKLKNNANFCGECGSKVPKEKKQVTKKTAKEYKPLTKQTKIILGIVLVIVISFIIGFNILGHSLSASSVSKKYMEALKTSNSDELYETLNIEGDTRFASKEAFSKIYNNDNNDLKGISSITLLNITYSSDKKSAVANYKVVKNDKEMNITVNLTKNAKKKYLFFDTWTVRDDVLDMLDITIVNNYTITVPSNSVVKIDDEDVTRNYINSEESKDGLDVYVLPNIFEGSYNISVVLPNKMSVTEEKRISYYYDSYTFDLDLNDLSDEQKDDIGKYSTDFIKSIYSNLINKKTFAELQKSNTAITDNLKDTYDDLYSKIVKSDSLSLLKFDISDYSITGIRVQRDGQLSVTIKYSYNYTTIVKHGDKTEEKNSKSNQNSTLIYDISDGSYKLTALNSPVKYFSVW